MDSWADHVFLIEGTLATVVFFAVLALSIFAFVHALLQPAPAYEAAGKLNKATWCTLLGVGVVLQFVPIGGGLIFIVFLVATLVYLADVRPAIAGLRRR